MEENKVNNRYFSPKNYNKGNKETVEIRLGKQNPAFNLVSIKARYRFHLLKNSLKKDEYDEYLRRCKNMYSKSCQMSAERNISDICLEENFNIFDIKKIYKKIDDKISSKRIRLNKYKEDNLTNDNLKKDTNFNDKIREITKQPYYNEFFNENKDNSILLRWNLNENNRVDFNNYKKMSSTHSSKFIISNNLLNNNKMIKTNYKITNKGNMNKKGKSSFGKNKKINKTFNPFANNAEILEENNKKQTTGLEGLYNYKTKQIPISGTSKGMTITNFGAIIYNNSIYRNKGISNLIYNSQSLPLIYNSKY